MFAEIISRRILKCTPMKICSRYITENNRVTEKTINQVQLLGRIGGDPQKRGTETHPVVIFSLATHLHYYQDDGTKKEVVDWHRICVFKPSLRDLVYNYMKKGQRVYVSGRINYGEIMNQAGDKVATTSIIADNVIFFNS